MAVFTVLWPVGAVEAGILSNFIRFLMGGTENSGASGYVAAVSLPLLGSEPSAVGGPVFGKEINSGEPVLSTTQDSALIATRNPIGTLPPVHNDQIIIYKVEPGDTPGAIAEKFGISLNTLLWVNNLRNPNLIKTGDELVILPVTGVQYEVERGDTLESIAKKFKGDAAEIAIFNNLAIGGVLEAGATVIIPDGELAPPPAALPESSRTESRYASLPSYSGYYLRPVAGGRRSRGIHGYNGVDLANSCGLPVLASAEGKVIISRSSGWNGGYGNYAVISHENGTQTLYAHLAKVLASPGQYLAEGSQIATIGSTGNSTGCHLHFEVRGAKNPF